MRQALGSDAGVPGEGTAELDLYIEEENVFVRGAVNGWVELACSRCLDKARLELSEPLAVTFLPQGQVPNEDGTEIDDDEDLTEGEDTYAYEGEEIDLEPLLRERILLALPYAPLCSEDCAGLCSQCGANLNQGECGCDRKVIDPRLAALQNLKV